jgi:predicted phosphodiesterase
VSDDLLRELLDKPVGPATPARKTNPERDFTRQVEVTGDEAAVTVRGSEDETTEDVAAAQLWAQGLDPAEWAVTGYRSSEWTMPNGETGVSRKFSFVRAGSPADSNRPNLDELIARIELHQPAARRPEGDHGFLVLLGDMQFGKIDGDGVEGTLRRTIGCLDRAADRLLQYSEHYPIGHVHLGWLGDHIEGFVSQGGANVWRTPLTLNEQIRLTRRTMLYALELFAPLAERVSMAAVPGNHGESVRFAGKGVTRYDDSHDTESLIAVADAAKLNPGAFGHVEFYVPETDELTVVLDVAGTVVAHAHGHQWRPGKHFEWWRGQAFSKTSAMHQADLLVAGHLHHEHVDSDGPRTFIQPPSMESESTWWRHAKGTTGAPGLIVAVTKDGRTDIKEVVRSE